MQNLFEIENFVGIVDDVGLVMNYLEYLLLVVVVYIVICIKQEIKEVGFLYIMFNIN